jgi:hypothetical protein
MKRALGWRSIRSVLVVILLAVVILGVAWVFVNWNDLRAFQEMPSGAYAKFMCSSLFVVGMTEDQARNWSALPVPIQELRIDYQTKSVTARALFHSSTARYEDERLGCTLE